ncbi:MAG: hypothetical protein A2041_13300 [Bacteroidetes bacterium GWA2_31_9b]|nr:MAG: hypothetical protein A2041_13300 [Bacteroidetes bacterium GWA2_31_9b]
MKTEITFIKRNIPHIIAIFIFIIISAIYFFPQLNGYRLNQSDHINALGMSKEISDFREQYHSEPLWTNSAFGGMPAYQISTKNSNVINSIKNSILEIIPRPIGYMFFLMIGFYILLLCFNVNPWLAILGAVAFGLSSLNILYLETGHNSKVHAISFIPPLIGSIIYAYRKNYLIGSSLLSVFVCLHLTANHLQMTYYLLYIIIAILLVEFYSFFKNRLLPKFLKISSILLLAGILGALPSISNLIVTYEYGKYTTRGKSELTISSDNKADNKIQNNALDSDYIKEYSLGFGEVWSLVIPNIKGGEMGLLGNNKGIMENVSPNNKNTVAQQASYWGEQNSSGGAFYFGASIFLLFVLGMFFVKDKIKWALFAVSLLAIILSWKYSNILDWFIKYIPLFSKFRDTKMILILAQVSFPLLGFLFLNRIMKSEINRRQFLYVSFSLIGLLLLFYVIPSVLFGFLSNGEIIQFDNLLENYKTNPNVLLQIGDLKNEIINARIDIFKKDCLRSLLFIVATASIVYLFILNKIKERSFILILGVLILIDLWGVDKRYLNNEKNGLQYIDWVKSFNYQNPYQASIADKEILNHEISLAPSLKQNIENEVSLLNNKKGLKSKDFTIEKEKIQFRELNFSTNYRVFSLLNPFSNSRTSYYHKSIGGYHGAKLKVYQELISFYISNEYTEIIKVLNTSPDNDKIYELLKYNIPILNMLNTKYIIYNLSAPPIVNPYHYGNAWFVQNIKIVENADEEVIALKSIDKNTAIIQKKYSRNIIDNIKVDSSASINLISYKPNHLIYETFAQHDQFAVFSEIYYNAGWNAYLDGKIVDYFKANYVLRAMNVPSGKHLIEFKFEPKSYYLGRKISNVGSGLIIIFILSVIFWEYRKRKQEHNT